MPLYGSNTGFRNLRDLLLFVVGVCGLVWTLATGRKGDVNIAALTTFAGLLASPYVLHTDEKRPPPEPPPAKRPAKRPAKKVPAKKVPAKKTTRRR